MAAIAIDRVRALEHSAVLDTVFGASGVQHWNTRLRIAPATERSM
jgi:hypothetical protein